MKNYKKKPDAGGVLKYPSNWKNSYFPRLLLPNLTFSKLVTFNGHNFRLYDSDNDLTPGPLASSTFLITFPHAVE